MKRILRNLFSAENNDGAVTNARGISTASGTVTASRTATDAAAEYTDGSHSYSYEQSEDASGANSTRAQLGSAIAHDNSGSDVIARATLRTASDSASNVAKDSHADSNAGGNRGVAAKPRRRANGTSAGAEDASESSRYSLRHRRNGAVVRQSGSNSARPTLSTGSVSQRFIKDKPLAKVNTVTEPAIALRAMPHATSARTTSGVVGRPGRVTTAEIEKATHSTLRNLCSELGVPAAGTKAELRERALKKISEHAFDGEVVQSLSAPVTPDTSVQHNPHASLTPATNDTATTTAVARGNEVQRSGGPPARASDTPDAPNATTSTAELSSTALFKFDPAEPAHARRQLFRGSTPQSSAVEEAISAPTSTKPRASHPLNSATSGERPPTAPQTPRAPSGPAVNRRRHSVRATTLHALENSRAPATSTHLSGVRLDPSGAPPTSSKPELPLGVDSMSPAGGKLPSRFAGAEGGPPDLPPADVTDRNRQDPPNTPSASPSANAPSNVEQAQAHARASTTVYASTPSGQPNPPPRTSAATPAPSLPPLRPMRRLGTASSLASPGEILRSYNEFTPRASASATPQSATNRASTFRQGSRPSSERFTSRMSGPLSQLDKRMSLRSPRLPFADAHFSPNARRPHSTGISSIPATTARGGQLTDLRPGTDRTQSQAPPLVALNGLNRRDQRARVPRMAQDTAKIVAALRRTAQENRHLCRSSRPMQPIGPPPSLKRPRDEEDIPRRPGKRTRTHTGASASVPVSQSTPRVNVQPTNPRPRPPSVADLQSAPPGTIIGQRRRTNPRSSVGFARSTALSEHAQGILRSKSTAGIDKKRKLGLGRSEEDAGSMKRSAKRRSLSLAASDAEIHNHVNDAIHESTQARASARKSVSFAEPSSSAPESAPDANPPSFAAPALKNSFAAAASTLSSDGDQANAEIPANSSENIKKPAPTPQVEVTEKEKETSLPEPVTASFRVPSAPFGTISFGAKSQSAEKPPADDPSTAATTPAPTPVAQSAPNPASVAPEKENDAAAVSKRNESLPGFGKDTVQKTSALVNENKDEKKEEEPSTNAISFAKSAPSFGSVTFGEPKSTPEGSAATASAPASTTFGQPSSSAATFGIASTATTTNSASVFGTSASAASFGSSAPTTTFGALSSSPAFGQKSPATSQQLSASSSAAALVTPSSPSLSAPSTFVANQEKAIPEGRKTEGTASSAPSMSQSTAQPSTPFSSTLFGTKAPEAESTTTNVVPMSTAAPVPAAPSSQFGSASSSPFAVTSSAPAFGTSTPAQASGPFSSSASAKPFGVSAPSSVPFGASAAFSASNPFGSESKPAGFGADSNPTFGTQSSAPTPSTTDGPFASFATPKSSKANPFGAFGASSSAGSAPFGSTPTTKGPYLFDVKPNPPSTPFGASSSNPFNSSGASFGAGSAAMSGGFGASTPNTGGGFGSGPFGRNNASGPFGDNNSTSGPFGSGSGGFGTSTPNGAGNFGFGSSGANPFATPTSNASGGGIPFGSNSGNNAFGGFGGGSQPSSGGFGGGGQPAGGFGHAAAPMSATPFGQAQQPQQQQPPFQLSHQANMFQQSGASGTNQFNMGGGGGGQSQGRRRVLRAKRHKR